MHKFGPWRYAVGPYSKQPSPPLCELELLELELLLDVLELDVLELDVLLELDVD